MSDSEILCEGRGWALIGGWALINVFGVQGQRLFEVGACSNKCRS